MWMMSFSPKPLSWERLQPWASVSPAPPGVCVCVCLCSDDRCVSSSSNRKRTRLCQVVNCNECCFQETCAVYSGVPSRRRQRVHRDSSVGGVTPCWFRRSSHHCVLHTHHTQQAQSNTSHPGIWTMCFLMVPPAFVSNVTLWLAPHDSRYRQQTWSGPTRWKGRPSMTPHPSVPRLHASLLCFQPSNSKTLWPGTSGSPLWLTPPLSGCADKEQPHSQKAKDCHFSPFSLSYFCIWTRASVLLFLSLEVSPSIKEIPLCFENDLLLAQVHYHMVAVVMGFPVLLIL